MTILDYSITMAILLQASPPLVNELVLLLITMVFTGVMAIMGWFLRDAAITLRNNTNAIQDLKLAFAKEQATTSTLKAHWDLHSAKVDKDLRDHARKHEATTLQLRLLESYINKTPPIHSKQYEEDSDS